MRELRLTRAQREKLFAGECPAIYGPRKVERKRKDGTTYEAEELRKCPVKPGDVLRLSSRLQVRVLRIDPKEGGWKLHYEVIDKRDPIRTIRRTPPVVAVPDADGALDEEAIKRAAQESAYGGRPKDAVDAEAEGVDEITLRRITLQAHHNARQQEVVNQARRERYELEQRLRRAREDAYLRGVDVSSAVRVIERQLIKIEKRVYEGRAA